MPIASSAPVRILVAMAAAISLFIGGAVSLASQASGASGNVGVKIQGFDRLSNSWTPGNTAGYAELEDIPFRLILANSSTAVTVDTLETVYDHERSGVPGIADLRNFQICNGAPTSGLPGATSCSPVPVVAPGAAPPASGPYVVGPTFRTASGVTQGIYTWHRIALSSNQTRTLLWGATLALGSHAYNGSALHMQIGAAVVNGGTVTFGSKDVPIPVNAIIATTTDKKINGSDGPVQVKLGDPPVSVTISVTTFGPAKGTQNLKVVDQLPSCLAYVAGSGSPTPTSVVAGAGGSVTWELNNVANRKTLLFSFKAAIVNTGNCENLAVTTSNIAPPSRDTVGIPVSGAPDLRAQKSCDPTTVDPGGRSTCTIRYDNLGTQDATGVTVEDKLQKDLTYVAGSTTGAGEPSITTNADGSTTLTWTVGAVARGAGGSISFDVKVPATGPAGTQTFDDVATVHAPGDSNPGNDSSTVTIKVTYGVDLSLDKGCPGTVAVGTQITQTLAWSSEGSSPATGVKIVDTLPAGMTYVSGSATPVAPSVSGNTLTFNLGAVNAGASGTITYKVTVASSGQYKNTAVISADQTDVDPADNSDDCTSGASAADVYVTKACPSTGSAGTNVTHTLSFGNKGNAPADGVVITDVLSGGQTYVSGSAKLNGSAFAAGKFSASGNTLTFTLDTLAAGATGTIAYSVHIPATSTTSGAKVFSDRATISTTSADENAANNDSGACSTTVTYAATLTVGKSGCPAIAVPGQLVTYTITYGNTGSAPAANATLVDTVPAGMSVAGSDGGTVSGSTVTWQLGSLAPGSSGSKTLKLRIVTDNAVSLTNKVTLSATGATTVSAQSTTTVRLDGRSTSGRSWTLDVAALGLSFVNEQIPSSSSADHLTKLDAEANDLLALDLLGLAEVGLVHSDSVSQVGAGFARTTSSSTVAGVNLLGGAITATTVRAVSQTVAGPEGAASNSAGSTFENLKINGTSYANVAPNTEVDVLGGLFGTTVIAKAHLYEVDKDAAPVNGSFVANQKVTMIRVVLLQGIGLLPAGAEIKVAYAESHATYPIGVACGDSVNTVSGKAFTAYAKNALGVEAIAGLAEIAALGGDDSNGVPAQVPGLVTTGTAANEAHGTIGTPPAANAASRTEAVNLLGGAVTADVLKTTSASGANGTVADTDFTFDFLNLKVGGTAITAPVKPNTTIAIPSSGKLILVVLNEQLENSVGGKDTEGTVNAVHAYVLEGSSISTEVIVTSAGSGAHLG